MKEKNKNRGKYEYVMAAAAIFAIAGSIIYVVNSVTGYMAGRGVDGWILVLSLIAIAGLAAVLIFRGRFGDIAADLIVYVATVLLIISFALFVLNRVSIIADIYFLPVNYPAEEATTLNVAIVGFILYILAIVAATAAAFFDRDKKK